MVRDATPADGAAVARLNAAAWKIAFRGIATDEFLDRFDGLPEGRRQDIETTEPPAFQLVCDRDGEVAGWLAAAPCTDEDLDPEHDFDFKAWYVHPDHWRRGVGAAMGEEGFRRLRRQGQWERVIVWTARDTPQSHGFYRSLGFEQDHSENGAKLHMNIPVVRFIKAL